MTSSGNPKPSKFTTTAMQSCHITEHCCTHGADPLKGREPDSPRHAAQQARRAQTYKRGRMEILTIFARMNLGKVELDARGQVKWKGEKLEEFVVIATRIDKTTGEEVGDVCWQSA